MHKAGIVREAWMNGGILMHGARSRHFPNESCLLRNGKR